ncbi:MAG: hypothetical protein ACRCUQ_00135 [Alphaproteobacteria bacterium]
MLEKNVVRLSVGAIFKETVCFFKSHFKEVMKITFAPTVLLLLISSWVFLLTKSQDLLIEITVFPMMAIYLALVSMLMFSASHLTLTGRVKKGFLGIHWSKIHTKIFKFNLIIFVFICIIFLVFCYEEIIASDSFDAPVCLSICTGSLVYLYSRFYFAISATSLGLTRTLGWSWRQTRGHSLKLLIPIAIFNIPSWLLSFFFPNSLLGGFVSQFFDTSGLILTTIAMGLVYKEFERKGALLP